MIWSSTRRGSFLLSSLLLLGIGSSVVQGGEFFRRSPPAPVYAPVPVAVPTAYAAPAGGLGTFQPTPVVVVRGNWPVGGGYSPLDMYGNTSMDLYGPISSFRTTSAPVLTYTRGYDGRSAIVEGTGFSNPMLPPISPIVYPTPATYYYGPRRLSSPPWWTNANTWIDQN